MAKCTFKRCSHDEISGGLCRGHYTQQYRGKKLTPLREVNTAEPVINGTKKCKQCKKIKHVSEFYVTGKKFGGAEKLSTDCKPCYSKKVVDRRK
jgi:hypothetical protein